MVKQKVARLIFSASLIAFMSVPQVQAADIYRYKNDQGQEIIGSRVPAEFVRNGYEVINDRGQVIRVVPRALSEEERAAQAVTLEQQRLAEEATRQQQEQDTLLLRLYRSPEEVIRRRDSTLDELEAQLSVINALHRDAEEDVQVLQTRVSNNEAAGNEPPASLVAQLESATEERDRLGRQIARIENEMQETMDTAQRNIDRLKELLNLD